MISVKPKTILDFARAVGALLAISVPLLAGAQVEQARRGPMTIHLFGTYTYGSTDWFWHENARYGYSLGGFLQTRHLLGLEARGSYLRWGNNGSQFDALAGPRVTHHFWRFSPYVAALGGVGHPIARVHYHDSPFESGNGGEWKLLGGVDYYASHHLSFRLGEISYAEMYALPKSLSEVDLSGGVVYHIPVRER